MSSAPQEASGPTAPISVVLDDEGEYFDEDPTAGRGHPPDPAGALTWQPMKPATCDAAFLAALQQPEK